MAASNTVTSYTKSNVTQTVTTGKGSPGNSSQGNQGSGGGKGAYSKGGSGSSADPKKAQKELQDKLDALADTYGREKAQQEKDLKAKLDQVNQKMAANDAAKTQAEVQYKMQSRWQPSQQKEQSTYKALRDRMGNAAYGSGLLDLNEGMARVDDMNDVELLNAYRENMDNIYEDWFQANEELVGDYNSYLTDADSAMTKLLNQYQTAVSNLVPELGLTKNIKASTKLGNAVTNAKATAKTAAKKETKATSKLTGKQTASLNKLSDAKTKVQLAKNNLKQAQANLKKAKTSKAKASAQRQIQAMQTAYNKASQDYKAKTSKAGKVVKSAATAQTKNTKAQSSLQKAKDAAKKKAVSVGKGTDKYTLKSVDVTPSKAFSKLLGNKMKSASAVNPATKGYFRGADETRKSEAVPNSGTVNTSTAAYKPYANDTLTGYNRRN